LYRRYEDRLPDEDRYLLGIPLEELLKKSLGFKQEQLHCISVVGEHLRTREREGHLVQMVRAQEHFHRRQQRQERRNTTRQMQWTMSQWRRQHAQGAAGRGGNGAVDSGKE